MAKTKVCKECKADIPKDARKCMHCGSKQGMGFLSSILVIILVLAGIGAIAGQNNTETTSAPVQKSAAQIKAEKQADAKQHASSMCMQAVRQSAKFPSSVDFSVFSSPGTHPAKGGGWVSEWAFTAKNSFGNKIPQMAYCLVRKGKLVSFNVTNR